MTAVPVNDNSSFTAGVILRDIYHLDAYDLRQVIAASIGLMIARQGVLHTGKALSNIMDAARPDGRPRTLGEIAFDVAQRHEITVADLKAPDGSHGARFREIALARQECFWLARRERWKDGRFVHSSPEIGQWFGGRDHATVLHGVKAHEKLMAGGAA